MVCFPALTFWCLFSCLFVGACFCAYFLVLFYAYFSVLVFVIISRCPSGWFSRHIELWVYPLLDSDISRGKPRLSDETSTRDDAREMYLFRSQILLFDKTGSLLMTDHHFGPIEEKGIPNIEDRKRR